jgi:hypothetical protein
MEHKPVSGKTVNTQEARVSKTREGKRTSTSKMGLKAMGRGRMWRKENVSKAANVEPTTQKTSNKGTEVKRELP